MFKPFKYNPKKSFGAILPALAALACLSAPAAAQTGTGGGQATIVQPTILFKRADLDFGALVVGTGGGTVAVNANTNARTTNGTLVTVGGGAHRAEFESRASVGVLLLMTGSPTVTLSRVGGGAANMTANLTYAPGAGIATVNVLGLGLSLRAVQPVQTIYVGGSMAIPAAQAPGVYNGTFTLTVNYL